MVKKNRMVKLGYTICYVPDVEAALSFFGSAFDMERKFITEEKDYDGWHQPPPVSANRHFVQKCLRQRD